jgi:outer membrane receptor protein involved in Fe transport
VNFAAYWTKHKDVQLTSIRADAPPAAAAGGPPTFFFNDRTANIPGVELEVQSAFLEGLELGGFISATWHRFKGGELDPQFAPIWLTDPENPALGTTLASFGRQVSQNTPALKYEFTVNYELPEMSLADFSYRLGVEVDYTWQSGTHPSSINHPVTKNSAYGLFNGRITLDLPEQNVQLALSGRNLADREYFYSGIWYRTFNILTRTYAPPRQVGVEITYRFGADAG